LLQTDSSQNRRQRSSDPSPLVFRFYAYRLCGFAGASQSDIKFGLSLPAIENWGIALSKNEKDQPAAAMNQTNGKSRAEQAKRQSEIVL